MILLLMMNEEESTTLINLYNTYKNDMLKIAYSILKDHHEAQDVVHTSIMKVNANLNRINLSNKHETRGFILMVTKNHALNVYRRRKKVAYFEDDFINDYDELSINDVEQNLLDYEKAREVAAIITLLNPRYAEIITLKYQQDLTNKEISEVLDCKESTVRVKLHRAKSALKRVLKEGNYE